MKSNQKLEKSIIQMNKYTKQRKFKKRDLNNIKEH